MSYLDDEPQEHECPRPLEAPVRQFDLGGMFLSPAGRWETITDLAGREDISARVILYTDRTGPEYCWQFWRSDKLPYVPPWLGSRERYVVVSEFTGHMRVSVTDSPRGWVDGYCLLTAQLQRGEGWAVADCPDGRTVEHITVPNKARVRAEVNRRARAHAKRLGLQVWRAER